MDVSLAEQVAELERAIAHREGGLPGLGSPWTAEAGCCRPALAAMRAALATVRGSSATTATSEPA